MSNRDYLGEFEHIVLLAVLRLDDQAYGVTVRREIEVRTKREVSIGAIYATLDRLEAKGYVQSRPGDPTPERGGRSKRFFRVTAPGVSAIHRTQDRKSTRLNSSHGYISYAVFCLKKKKHTVVST